MPEHPEPTAEELEQLRLAVIHKAVRELVLTASASGSAELTEYGHVTTRPDHTIGEMLSGLRGRGYGASVPTPEPAEVIRLGLEGNPADPGYNHADIESAIAAAVAWVRGYLEGWGVAFG